MNVIDSQVVFSRLCVQPEAHSEFFVITNKLTPFLYEKGLSLKSRDLIL